MFPSIVCPPDQFLHAASVIVFKDDLKTILAVSRKNNPNDLGRPGGKVDPGENFMDCAIRECFEETGLVVYKARFVCGELSYGKDGKNYWNGSFLAKVTHTNLFTKEAGRATWTTVEDLISDRHTFGLGNRECMKETFKLPDLKDWINL